MSRAKKNCSRCGVQLTRETKVPRQLICRKCASRKTQEWMNRNKERVSANSKRRKAEKVEARDRDARIWESRGRPTIRQAVRGVCSTCSYWEDREKYNLAKKKPRTGKPGWVFKDITFIRCERTACPLHPFRNSNPMSVKTGSEMDNLHSGKKAQEND